MAVLVTGGAGYIGSHTIVELLEASIDVVVVDNYINSKPEALNRVQAITGKDLTFYEVDILDEKSMEQVFENHEIEAVIHFAGLKAVGESVALPLSYYHNNITGSIILFKLMNKYNVKRLVFSSSATVYGLSNPSPLTENLPLSTTNPYGTTKWMIEKILQDIYHADSTWQIVLLRYFNPIGAHESGLIGEDPNGIPNNLMPYVTQVGIGKRKQLGVFGKDYDTPDGTGVRDYIHVVDLAKGHLSALTYITKHKGIEAINLGTGNGHSVLEVIKTFEKANNVTIPYTFEKRRPGDIGTCYADVSKAKKLLGWVAKRSLEDMCRDAWRWQSMYPEGYVND
ncbi:UDP-glucose 4-epimerase GalE [Petrocella sp. FN5]|uniref:UDP-glucose 4-epimerase GalE n=1 Tax=Petrocella sp. FN5 TaxID=3032002 RepID=UPI0023DB4952|nr:UDP-glucose 4-epimerase GalE [Petrocella sp. FN5]MDF1616631.1 UDP-glucose 4-epimerase GalE [Petrocella sp. FN5]